jgi:hypothetical protein
MRSRSGGRLPGETTPSSVHFDLISLVDSCDTRRASADDGDRIPSERDLAAMMGWAARRSGRSCGCREEPDLAAMRETLQQIDELRRGGAGADQLRELRVR